MNIFNIDAHSIYSCDIVYSCIEKNNLDLIKILDTYKNYPYGYINSLEYAIKFGHKNMVEYFLKKY